jgi:type VI secretion system FHA domain protein
LNQKRRGRFLVIGASDMYLTLEVVSPQAASLGVHRRQIVGPRGLTIGRAPGNDWLIPDPYVSKQQARITFSNGRFFVEGLGRNPIAIGKAGNAIPNSQPTPLGNGDRLFVDQYEILVTEHGADPSGLKRKSSDDPFTVAASDSPCVSSWDVPAPGSLPAATPIPGSESHTPACLIQDIWDGGMPDVSAETAELDPLVALKNGDVQQRRPFGEPVAPPVVSAALEATAHSASIAAPVPNNSGADSDVTVGARPLAARGPHRPTPDSAALASAAASSVAGLDLVELLRGAGISERELSPEVARELGKVLRVVIQGVMQVLQARAEIKAQFRLPVTRIQTRENNPLKLSPNVESALHTLLVQRNPGYLPTVRAFEDAFSDICNHQMAALEGVRVAFKAMLSAFDPQELEKEFERTVKRTGLLGGLSGRSRYWDLYSDRFLRFGGDSDETFRRLFGEFFAQAYESQLELLKALQTGADADG